MRFTRLAAVAAALILSKAAFAQGISVQEPWVQEAPPNAKVMAGYLVLENHAGKRTLTGASSAQFARVEIHRTMMKDGMAHMMPQDSLEIDGHGRIVFAPGGYHLMLIGPKSPLKAGDSVTITLQFSDGDTVKVNAPVKKAMGAMMMEHHHHHE